LDENFRRKFRTLTDQQRKDFLEFEGNAQSIRLVSNCQLLLDSHGLNFTIGTLSALCKYLAASNHADKGGVHARSKPGYFASEQEIVQIVRRESSTGDHRHPITYLVEAADDIVYSTVDLEDGLKKDILDWTVVTRELGSCSLGKSVPEETDSDLAGSDLTGKAQRDAKAVVLRTKAIGRMAHAVVDTFFEKYKLIMNGDYDGELVGDNSCNAKDLVAISKKNILKPYLYTNPAILKLEVRGRDVIHALMDQFWEAVDNLGDPILINEYWGKLYLLLSDNYRHGFKKRIAGTEHSEREILYAKLQLITDQIAGMTDTHACKLHKDLFNG
jgi:dGTPase